MDNEKKSAQGENPRGVPPLNVALRACLVVTGLCLITHVAGCEFKDLVLHFSVDVGVLAIHLMLDR